MRQRLPGVIGHSSYDYLNAARHFTQKMNISRITVFYCLNDVFSQFKEQAIPGSQVRDYGGGILNYIKLNFRLYDVMKATFFDRSKSYFEFINQFYKEDHPLFKSSVNDLLMIKEICDTQNIQFDVYIFPYEYQLRVKNDIRIFYAQILLKTHLQAKGVTVYDFADYLLQLSHDSQLYYLYGDGIHFSDYGHQNLSEHILNIYRDTADPIDLL